MQTGFTHNSANEFSEQLAAAAGAGDLAAAAAIDAEEGDAFLQTLLADQMAAAHLLTMRMAAAADRAIGAAVDSASQGGDDQPLFDLAAARFAGAAARLNGRYCRGLQTLRALAGPGEKKVSWVGYCWQGHEKLTPEETARRINRMAFYRARNDALPEPARDGHTRRRPPIDPAERAAITAAQEAADNLLLDAGVDALANASKTHHTKLFAHQLAATHRLMMRLSGRADTVMTDAADAAGRPEGLRLTHGAARLMERFRHGVAMLQRLRTTPDDPDRVQSFWAGSLSESEREREREEDIAAGLDPDTGLPLTPPPGATYAASTATRTAVLQRRGRLNNGNPGGDFLAAPRCGAKTRAGCGCRQPAMANGRCRFHGGMSTGPRTAAGLVRARSARFVHGLRSAEAIALSAAAAATYRRLGVLLADAPTTVRGARNRSSSVVSVRSVVKPLPAGHGVDRSESKRAAASAVILPFARTSGIASRPAKAPSPRRMRAVASS